MSLLVESLTQQLLYAAVCTAAHFIIAWFLKHQFPVIKGHWTKKQRLASYNRGVSTLHAVYMFFHTVEYFIYVNPGFEILTDVSGISLLTRHLLDSMMGYLWYDMTVELLGTRQTDTLLHHILGIASHMSTRLSNNSAAGFYSMCVYIAEGSTPSLNLSWFLHQLKVSGSPFLFAAASLLASFFLCRVVQGPLLIYHMWTRRKQWGGESGTTALFWGNFIIILIFVVLNFVWFSKLVALAVKKDKVAKEH